MKGWVSGLVVGIVFGSALAGAAGGQWQSATNILEKNDPIFQMGYIEGIEDTLSAVTGVPGIPDNSRMIFVRKQLACIEVHARGTAGEFRHWAEGVWRSHVDSGRGNQDAASLLIASACK